MAARELFSMQLYNRIGMAAVRPWTCGALLALLGACGAPSLCMRRGPIPLASPRRRTFPTPISASSSPSSFADEPDFPLLDETSLASLEQLSAPLRSEAASESAVQAARTISQLQLIQSRDAASPPSSIVVIGPADTTVLHRQTIELLSYALVLSGNRVLTSGGTDADMAVIRGALRANERMLTVVVPNTAATAATDGEGLLRSVRAIVELQHTNLPAEIESRLVYAELVGGADKVIAFAFHRSRALLQAIDEAQAINVETCVLYLD
jgi:hypothetical protein